ncbi:hypothetical protein GF420_02250, partial [candidate division GN15 bacterium]|nr:hypothetical protein [candidate division GN15 bacterium]
MIAREESPADRGLIVTFSLFAFTSTFSIAISQIFLGLSLAVFLYILIRNRTHPFSRPLRFIYWAIAVWIAWLFFTCLLGDTPLR